MRSPWAIRRRGWVWIGQGDHRIVWSWRRFSLYDTLAFGWRRPGVIDIGPLAIVIRPRPVPW